MKTPIVNIETGRRIKARDLSLRERVNEDADTDLTEVESDGDEEAAEVDVMPPMPLVENDGSRVQLV